MIRAGLVPTVPVEVLMEAYAKGRFPMCQADGALYWHDPDPRAIIPLEKGMPNSRMRRLIRSGRFTVTRDQAFEAVIFACSQRKETWIDDRLIASYGQLHAAGHAHSVEVWKDGALVGGIYGVALNGAFFGESMFNRVDNAGKVAFYALADHLRERGFKLFDTQYINQFTAKLGAAELPRAMFRQLLAQALQVSVRY